MLSFRQKSYDYLVHHIQECQKSYVQWYEAAKDIHRVSHNLIVEAQIEAKALFSPAKDQ